MQTHLNDLSDQLAFGSQVVLKDSPVQLFRMPYCTFQTNQIQFFISTLQFLLLGYLFSVSRLSKAFLITGQTILVIHVQFRFYFGVRVSFWVVIVLCGGGLSPVLCNLCLSVSVSCIDCMADLFIATPLCVHNKGHVLTESIIRQRIFPLSTKDTVCVCVCV